MIRPMRASTSLVFAASMLAVVGWCADATADHIIAGGTRISGDVKGVTADGVEFKPEFAEDSFLVSWEKLESVETDGDFEILYGEGGAIVARLRGVSDGKLVVGDTAIDPKDIVLVSGSASETPGFRERLRSTMRYWHGGVDVGLAVQQATTDNLGMYFAVRALRAKGPTRLILGADYRFGEENPPDDDERRTKDSATALVRGEYDITKRIYAFASTDALYDSIQNLSLRAIPKLGAGYTVWEREPKEKVRDFFQVESGAGWVYEKYMHDCSDAPGSNIPFPPPSRRPFCSDGDNVRPDDDYFTIVFGAAAAVLLPREMAFDWRFDYLPNVTDWGDYVIRTGAGLSAILIAPISLRIALVDVYDSTPSADTDENSLNFDTTLSVAW
jgi:hypothetical protein